MWELFGMLLLGVLIGLTLVTRKSDKMFVSFVTFKAMAASFPLGIYTNKLLADAATELNRRDFMKVSPDVVLNESVTWSVLEYTINKNPESLDLIIKQAKERVTDASAK